MLPAQVDILLENYKRNAARQGHIIAEIGRMKREIALIEKEAAALSAAVITGMPSSGALRDETATKAAMLADGDLPQTRSRRETIARLMSEQARIEQDKCYVENWLLALNEREKHVITSLIIEGNSWQSVAASFAREFGQKFCENTLRRLKTSALNKIYDIAA